MPKTNEERIAVLETDVSNIKDDLVEMKADDKKLHSRINKLLSNEIAHVQQDRVFWAKIIGLITTIVTIAEIIVRAVFA